MLTFWGEVSLTCLVVSAAASWVISLIPSPKRDRKVNSAEHGLYGGNRERSESSFYGWH